MSNRLKNPGKTKLQKRSEVQNECRASDDSVYFNFRYLTSNKKHDFDYLDKGKGKSFAKTLLKKLENLSQFSWTELGNKGRKNGGFEMIAVSQLNTNITDKVKRSDLSDDTKLHVFRFGDCRLIGLKAQRCRAVIHILGCDWDYSLYDHGS